MLVLAVTLMLRSVTCYANDKIQVDADGQVVEEEAVSILLIGNSLTKYGSHEDGRTVQGHLQRLAEASGKHIYVKTVAYGGTSLRNIAGLNPEKSRQAKNLRKKIKLADWDYVVIQELSRLHYDKFEERSLPAIEAILDMVWTNSADTEVLVYLPRGFDLRRKSSKVSTEEMECHIGAAGTRLVEQFGLELVPVGMHCYRCATKYPDIRLMGTDQRHPSRAGYFLAAACIYQKVFNEKPKADKDALDFAGISDKEAKQLIGLWGDGIESETAEMTLQKGESSRMQVNVGEDVGSAVRFTTLDEHIAAVDEESGMITATGSGMTVVMATSIDGWQAYCTVYVPYDVPKGVTAETETEVLQDGQSTSSVVLRWKKQPGAKYAVYRSKTKKGPYTLLGQTKKKKYEDMTVSSGQTWYYKVTAVNGYAACESGKTEAVAVTVP